MEEQTNNTTALTKWLIDYTEIHSISLTALAHAAGLSSGTLRSLINHPERIPTIETCIRLSLATDKLPEDIVSMAGVPTPQHLVLELLHPERGELLRIYDQLSSSLRVILVEIARAIQLVQIESGMEMTTET